MKQRNLKNRNDKINFLKGLKAGKTNVSDLMPEKLITWMCTDGKFYVNGRTGESVPKDEFEKRKRSTPIIYIPTTLKIKE